MNRRSVSMMVSASVILAALAVVGASGWDDDDDEDDPPFARVLLLSVDGLHAADLARYVETHPDSPLAALSARGRTYANAIATKPSDSFPGTLAMVTGGTPRSTGVYYDDGYDRLLVPATGTCVPGATAPGTRAQWKQNLDRVPSCLRGVYNVLVKSTFDPGCAKLPRQLTPRSWTAAACFPTSSPGSTTCSS